MLNLYCRKTVYQIIKNPFKIKIKSLLVSITDINKTK